MSVATIPTIHAPRGTQLRCKGWQQEAALRCLMNNLDPEVAERPADLVVYGGIGKAARNWECFHAIVRELEHLGNEETLLVQSGKPVAVFPHARHGSARDHRQFEPGGEVGQLGALPRARPQGPDDVRADDGRQSWIYIGTQGILQGTFQTFAALAERHFGGSLEGKLVVTGGMGGMGGAQPLSVTMNGGVVLVIEVDPHRIERRARDALLRHA